MFWLNVNKISLGKIKKKNTSADTQIRHFTNDKRTAVTGAEMLFGDFFPLAPSNSSRSLCKSELVSIISQSISFPELFIDHCKR